MVTRIQAVQPLLQVRWLADTIHDVPLQRPGVLADAIEGLSTPAEDGAVP